jgi:hypothetical protein
MNILKNLLDNRLNLNDKNNKLRIIGILSILIILWSILYIIPSFFINIFNTLLGNLILFIVFLLVFANNKIYGIFLGILFIILYRFSVLSKEGFTWNSKSTYDFLKTQSTINKQTIFDVNMIQKNQASQEELDYFNKHGIWPWSQKTIELYMESLTKNPFIRTTPEDALNYTRTIYNESAILQILSYQTKEGQFLLNGVLIKDPSGNKLEELPNGFGDFPYKSGLLENRKDDIIKCNLDNTNNPYLERTTYTGKGGIYGEQTKKIEKISFENLEKIIPGFNYLTSPCNPCVALKEKPDYSCPFKLQIKNKSPFISDVWQYLWNINDNPLESQPSFLSEYIDPKKFPLLSELQNELNKK